MSAALRNVYHASTSLPAPSMRRGPVAIVGDAE